MASNTGIISANISIFDDLVIFAMSFWKKWKVKRIFQLEIKWFCDIHYAVTPLSGLAVNNLAMLYIKVGIHITM